MPDGVEPASLELWSDTVGAFPTEDKIALAIELERAALAADTRISGIESAEYIDTAYESAVATSTGIAAAARETGCYVSVYTLAEADGETQTGFGFSIGRDPSELDPPSPPPMPPTGPLGFLGRRSQGANGSPSCSTRG